MSWIHEHLREFVNPRLLEHTPVTLEEARGATPYLLSHEMSVVKNMWRSAKRRSGDRVILLAGRDVWVWEVLARRENFPTVFRPDISRHALRSVKEDYSEHFLFDTGFVGSIPRGLGMANFVMASHGGNPRTRQLIKGESKQVFPRMTGSRSLALKIENLPKYWKAGFVRDSAILQEFSDEIEFRGAAILTCQIWIDNSPRFSEGKMQSGRRQDLYLDEISIF